MSCFLMARRPHNALLKLAAAALKAKDRRVGSRDCTAIVVQATMTGDRMGYAGQPCVPQQYGLTRTPPPLPSHRHCSFAGGGTKPILAPSQDPGHLHFGGVTNGVTIAFGHAAYARPLPARAWGRGTPELGSWTVATYWVLLGQMVSMCLE
jgi:hypothetical protein